MCESEKVRIFVVSSYHREYLWSQATQDGLCSAMLRFGYLDDQEQIDKFTINDFVESSRSVIKKEWMDTKRKYSKLEIAKTTNRIMNIIDQFDPDIVLLGDDNATNYIGNQLLDTDIPVVFWGVNGLPLKYGLLDGMDEPGHNVTGIWQSGYHQESLELLKGLVPNAQTFGIIACDSETTRPKIKQIRLLDREGEIPLKLMGTVVTNSWEEFKNETLNLAEKVDAFFVLNHDTIKDYNGNHINMMSVGKWYLENIDIPETSHEGQFVLEGMLCTANDSGYNQSYEAFLIAMSIIEQNYDVSKIQPRSPQRGPFMVNKQRAQMLGISLESKSELIEELVNEALALKGK